MKMFKILLFGSIFATLEWSVVCKNEYVVNTFNGITEVRSDGSIPYLVKHPDANTDEFSEGKRLELCREGYEHVLRHEEGKSFVFLENNETEKLKAYVLVNPPISDEDMFSDDIVHVRPAYACPTNPLTYIHVNCDRPDVTEFWVIFKKNGPIFTFSQIKTYQLYLPEAVEEANVEEMTDAAPEDIGNSYFDTDVLTQNQRLHMCKRGMSIAPETGIVESKSTDWGKSKYYTLWDPVSVDDSLSERTYWQAFACPTTPVMYIHTEAFKPDDYIIFWPFVKKSEIEQNPTLNILCYELTIANSMYAEEITPPKNGTERIEKFERDLNHCKEMRKRKRRRATALASSKLKNEQRLRIICAKAMSTVFGQTAEFITNDDDAGQSQCFRFEYFMNVSGSFDILSSKVVEAYRCPTVPEIYLHITEQPNSTYLAEVVVLKEDLALLQKYNN